MSNTSEPPVIVSYPRPGITVVTINRPHRKNAVDSEAATLLHSAFQAFAHDDSQHIAILTGSHGTFCSGADLAAIQEGKGNTLSRDMDEIGPMGPTRLVLNKPVIAAIEGYAVAGGMELALWCDLRVIREDAKMGILCRSKGVPLIDGGSVRLPRLIGGARALDLSLTGRLVQAEEAQRLGLVTQVVPGDQSTLEHALQLATSIISNPLSCMLNDRKSTLAAIYGYEQSAEATSAAGKADLRLRGDFRKAMQTEFDLGLKSLEALEREGTLQQFLGRKKSSKL